MQRDRDEIVERVIGGVAFAGRKSGLEPSQERSIDVPAADVPADVCLRRFDA
jgi:hypothetical protein